MQLTDAMLWARSPVPQDNNNKTKQKHTFGPLKGNIPSVTLTGTILYYHSHVNLEVFKTAMHIHTYTQNTHTEKNLN